MKTATSFSSGGRNKFLFFDCLLDGKQFITQFGGIFYDKEKGFPTKGCPSGNDGQLSERKQCNSQRWNGCEFYHARYDVDHSGGRSRPGDG